MLDKFQCRLEAVVTGRGEGALSAKRMPVCVAQMLGPDRVARSFFLDGRFSTSCLTRTTRRRRIDHWMINTFRWIFYTKILWLSDAVNTAPGGAIANERRHFTQQFPNVMLSEVRRKFSPDC